MKRCIKCGTLKPLADYYEHPNGRDGTSNQCKECALKYSKANRCAKARQRAEYDRARDSTKRRKKYLAEYRRFYRRHWPERIKARTAVSNALRDKRLARQPCEVCGDKAQARHVDYNEPLNVRWLCKKHSWDRVAPEKRFPTAGPAIFNRDQH